MDFQEELLVNFPNLEKLSVDEYRLYPGLAAEGGLDLAFSPGPWIVLGTNGLGKSTLLLILKHVLTGPARIREAGFTGGRSDVLQVDQRFFAARVGDAARAATAEVHARFGTALMSVCRRLSDLSLVRASLQDGPQFQQATNEDEYRTLLTSAMGVASFEDALRVLDRVSFFLEGSEPLVWDLAAQFELFRAILVPEISEDLRRFEGEIVSADSSARNLNAVLYKLVNRRDQQFVKHENSAETRARLAKASAELEEAETQGLRLLKELDGWEERRSDARIELKRADRAADEAAHVYEQIKFEVLRHAFAGITPNDQYVFLKLIADRVCSACGNPAEQAGEELERRRAEDQCLVCGSDRRRDSKVTSTTTAMQTRAAEAFCILQTARDGFISGEKGTKRRRRLPSCLMFSRQLLN